MVYRRYRTRTFLHGRKRFLSVCRPLPGPVGVGRQVADHAESSRGERITLGATQLSVHQPCRLRPRQPQQIKII
jgi:hypothetical protein